MIIQTTGTDARTRVHRDVTRVVIESDDGRKVLAVISVNSEGEVTMTTFAPRYEVLG